MILASGYYYPTARADVLLLSGPAVPLLGDIMRYTVSPILSRLLWPLLMRKIFGPAKVPAKFSGFPKEMAVRPSQIRASAAETALIISSAFAQRGEYASLKMPVVIIAGEQDRLIDIDEQSALPSSGGKTKQVSERYVRRPHGTSNRDGADDVSNRRSRRTTET